MLMCFKSHVLSYSLTIILLEGISTFSSDYRHSDQFLFLKKIFFGNLLDLQCLLVLGGQQSECYAYTCIHSFLRFFSKIGNYRLLSRVPSRSLLVLYFIYNSVYMSIPISQFILPLPIPSNCKFVSHIYNSISVLYQQMSSSVPFMYYYYILNFDFFLFFFGHTMWYMESQFPDQRSNLCPLQWKPRVLTIGLPGKPLYPFFRFHIKTISHDICQNNCFLGSFLILLERLHYLSLLICKHVMHVSMHSVNLQVVSDY